MADQSALNLLLLMGPPPSEFQPFGESDERYHVHGGNDGIVQRLVERVGDHQIETGAVLEALRRRADGQIELGVRLRGTSTTMAAPHVILAIPFTMLRAVKIEIDLPPAKRRAIDELGYGTNAKLMLGFESRLWRTKFGTSGMVLTDLPFQCTWETSRGQDGGAGILTNFTGGRHGALVGEIPAGVDALHVVGALESIYPGIANTRWANKDVRFHWPTNPWVKGSYAAYKPGQWTTIHGAEGERVENLHFAGEHCSLESQGFMNGAVETGEMAATGHRRRPADLQSEGGLTSWSPGSSSGTRPPSMESPTPARPPGRARDPIATLARGRAGARRRPTDRGRSGARNPPVRRAPRAQGP